MTNADIKARIAELEATVSTNFAHRKLVDPEGSREWVGNFHKHYENLNSRQQGALREIMLLRLLVVPKKDRAPWLS